MRGAHHRPAAPRTPHRLWGAGARPTPTAYPAFVVYLAPSVSGAAAGASPMPNAYPALIACLALGAKPARDAHPTLGAKPAPVECPMSVAYPAPGASPALPAPQTESSQRSVSIGLLATRRQGRGLGLPAPLRVRNASRSR